MTLINPTIAGFVIPRTEFGITRSCKVTRLGKYHLFSVNIYLNRIEQNNKGTLRLRIKVE